MRSSATRLSIGREQDLSGGGHQTLGLNEAQIPRRGVDAGHVVFEVLQVDVIDSAPCVSL